MRLKNNILIISARKLKFAFKEYFKFSFKNIISLLKNKMRKTVNIKLNPNVTTNVALTELITRVNVLAFKEIIPTFNDIFIQVVGS